VSATQADNLNNTQGVIDNKGLSTPDNYDVDKVVQSSASKTSLDANVEKDYTSDNTNNTNNTSRKTTKTNNTTTTKTPNDITSKNINLEKSIQTNVKTAGIYSFSYLANLINEAGETLNLPPGTIYQFDETTDSAYINGIPITSSITIFGPGATIDGSNKARIFNIVGDNSIIVNINTLTIKNGNSEFATDNKDGGSIYVNLTAPMIDEQGNFKTLVNLTRVIIMNSHSTRNGGGAYLASPTKIDSMTFINNTANYGGAIYVDTDGNKDFPNYNFHITNNSAKYDGGGLYIKGNHLGIVNVTFDNNTAGRDGGAVYWEGIDGLLENTNYTNNSANRSAGAIYWKGGQGTLYHAQFYNNTAKGIVTDTLGGGDGGAIMWLGSHGEMDDSIFEGNTAKYRGGAIFLQPNFNMENPNHDETCEDINVTNSVFTSNEAGTNGGAIDWFVGASFGKVQNTTFTNNIAKRAGGAINWCGNNGTIINSTFENNTAEGINSDDRTLAIPDNSTTKGGNGGAVLWIGSDGLIYNNTFKNNYAHVFGGAVFIRDNNNITINLCKFDNNGANNSGGALNFYNNSKNGRIINSEFTNNYANRSAGAIYWFGTNGIMYNSIFINNTATGTSKPADITTMYWIGITPYDILNHTGDGGAVLWLGTEGDIHNTTFTNNTATRSGGSIYWQGSIGEIKNSTFINNRALGKDNSTTTGGDGGAIIWSGSDGNITASLFKNNSAAYRGGAVYMTSFNSTEHSDNNRVSDSNFINNTPYSSE